MPPTLDPPPPYAICEVCRRPLNPQRIYEDGVEQAVVYLHGPVLDSTIPVHRAVPLFTDRSTPDLVSECDFCGAPGSDWDYPARDFMVFTAVLADMTMSQGSASSWGACEACHDDVEADRFDLVLARFVARNGPQRPDTIAMIKVLHSNFTANRTGPAVRK